MSDRHACPDCGASHKKRAARQPAPTTSQAASTDLRATRCHHCRQPILAGRIDGLDRALEPQPLNEIGWHAYRGIGRSMFTRHEQRARLHSHATRWPPDDWRYFHVVHECGKPVPEPLQENNIVRHKRTVKTPENPPF